MIVLDATTKAATWLKGIGINGRRVLERSSQEQIHQRVYIRQSWLHTEAIVMGRRSKSFCFCWNGKKKRGHGKLKACKKMEQQSKGGKRLVFVLVRTESSIKPTSDGTGVFRIQIKTAGISLMELTLLQCRGAGARQDRQGKE
jgi:hypothetical protein